jgi:hypothetical protein
MINKFLPRHIWAVMVMLRRNGSAGFQNGGNVPMRKKGDLPVKDCAHCRRPMIWRKAWAKNWNNVSYCSDRCRREAKGLRAASTRSDKG